MTPGNPTQPQVPGPPITFQEKPAPPKVLATAKANGEGFDENGKKLDEYKDVAYADSIKPCKDSKCPKLQTSGSGKDLTIYCQRIELCGGGGKECEKAECHMLVATMAPKEKAKWEDYAGGPNHGMISSEKSLEGQKDKDKAKKEELKAYAFKPEKGKAYRCSCY